jgi:hypothetical protein
MRILTAFDRTPGNVLSPDEPEIRGNLRSPKDAEKA